MDIDLELVQRWRAAALREVEQLEQQLGVYQATVQLRKEQLAAIDRLLESLQMEHAAEQGASSAVERPEAGSLTDAVVAVLDQEGGPLHYREIAKRLKEKGVRIPGGNPEANLIAHMHRDNRLSRVARGTYSLAVWNLRPAPERRRRRRAPK